MQFPPFSFKLFSYTGMSAGQIFELKLSHVIDDFQMLFVLFIQFEPFLLLFFHLIFNKFIFKFFYSSIIFIIVGVSCISFQTGLFPFCLVFFFQNFY